MSLRGTQSQSLVMAKVMIKWTEAENENSIKVA